MNKASDKAKSGGKNQLSGRIIKNLNKISGEYVAGLALSKPSASPAASPPPKPPMPNRTANREKFCSSSFTSKNRHVSHSFTIGYDILYTQKAILSLHLVSDYRPMSRASTRPVAERLNGLLTMYRREAKPNRLCVESDTPTQLLSRSDCILTLRYLSVRIFILSFANTNSTDYEQSKGNISHCLRHEKPHADHYS